MELDNGIKNEINNEQNNFLNSIIGKTINTAIDVGLKTILPDLIEDEVIYIKNSILSNGLKEGIHTAIESAINLGKSAAGIFTGHFENISQIEKAIGNGGIIDTISDVLDISVNKAYELGYINKTVNTMITKGKNIILDNVSKNIEDELQKQNNISENLEKNIENWKNAYNDKDFNSMENEIIKIKEELKELIPLENILKESRKIENIHNLISKNGHNFEITDLEKELINKFN